MFHHCLLGRHGYSVNADAIDVKYRKSGIATFYMFFPHLNLILSRCEGV